MKRWTFRYPGASVRILVTMGIVCGGFSMGRAVADNAAAPRTALEVAQSERARLLAERTVRIALDGLTEISNDEVANLQQSALADMQQNIAANRTKAESLQRFRSVIEKKLQDRIDDQIKQTALTLLAKEGISTEQFRAGLGADFEASVTAQKRKFSTDKLPQIFNAAREQAVSAQLKLLQQSAYPTQQDVDAVDRAGWTSEGLQTLGKDTRTRVLRTVPERFEETDAAADTTTTKIVGDVKAQRDRQMGVVSRPPPSGLLSEGQLEAWLRNEVETEVVRARANETADHPVYDILPSVRNKYVVNAKNEEKDRWFRSLRSYQPEIRLEDIEARLRRDITRYRDPKASEQLFVADSIAVAEGEVVNSYVKKAGAAPDAPAFRERLRLSIAPGGEQRVSFETTIQQFVAPLLNKARLSIAREQYAAGFAPVESGTWQPTEDVIARGKLKADDIADFDKAVGLPGVRTPGTDNQQLLVETETLVVSGVRHLITESQSALDRQRAIVRGLEPKMKQEITDAAPEARARNETWIARLTDLVTLAWEKERLTLWAGRPPKAEERKYVDLFATTRDDIQRTIESLLKQVADTPPVPPANVSAPTQSAHGALLRVLEILAVVVAVGAVIWLIWWLLRRRPPARQRTSASASGGSEGMSGAGASSGGPGPGGPKGPNVVPFEGIVVEVRDLARTIDLFDDVTDLQPSEREKEFVKYQIGPLKIYYVQEGHLPENVSVKGHVERLRNSRRVPGPSPMRAIEGN